MIDHPRHNDILLYSHKWYFILFGIGHKISKPRKMSEDNLSKTNYFSDGDTSDSDYEADKNFDEIYRYNCPNCSKKFTTKAVTK